jgi:hypothetical protein
MTIGGRWRTLAWLEVDGQSRKRANWDKTDSQTSPSTSSHGTPGQAGQALRDYSSDRQVLTQSL